MGLGNKYLGRLCPFAFEIERGKIIFLGRTGSSDRFFFASEEIHVSV